MKRRYPELWEKVESHRSSRIENTFDHAEQHLMSGAKSRDQARAGFGLEDKMRRSE